MTYLRTYLFYQIVVLDIRYITIQRSVICLWLIYRSAAVSGLDYMDCVNHKRGIPRSMNGKWKTNCVAPLFS